MAPLKRVADDAVAALPDAVDPLALSLNENPFSPLPAVRSALVSAIDSVNRYPEFLPERLRRLIADRVGVAEDQVVLGAGATGVTMQLLHATTEGRGLYERLGFARTTLGWSAGVLLVTMLLSRVKSRVPPVDVEAV